MPEAQSLIGRLTSAFRRRKKVDLVVGLDFGTSSTKVAYRELGATARKVTPITFGHRLKTYPDFCLPSVGCFDKNGRFVWGAEAVRKLKNDSWSAGIRRLKVLLAGQQDAAFRDERTSEAFERYLSTMGFRVDEYRPEYLVSAALAKQMDLVRGHLAKQYPGAELDIRFNICVPIDHLEHGSMPEVHNKVNHVAEELYNSWTSDGWDENDLIDVAATKFDGASGRMRPEGRVFAMPEAMAEVASYLVSLETKRGIHAVLDIGSGTTDLSIFNLMGHGVHDRDCYWYAARNVPRGAGYVEAAVAERLRNPRLPTDIVTEEVVQGAITKAQPDAEVAEAIYGELKQIWRSLIPTWTEGYGRHMMKQTAWENVPVFACGGGSRLHGVKEVFSKAWVPNFRDFTVRSLPIPDDYDSLKGKVPFDRLSVAYGLTFLGPELGGFSLPADSPDHTPLRWTKELPMPWTDGEPG